MSEFFATIFGRALCQWSCGSFTAFFSWNFHRFLDGCLFFRALSLLASFLRSTYFHKGFLPGNFCEETVRERIFCDHFLESLLSMESW